MDLVRGLLIATCKARKENKENKENRENKV